MKERAGEEKAAKVIDERLGFLTPILKGFLTEVRPSGPPLSCRLPFSCSIPAIPTSPRPTSPNPIPLLPQTGKESADHGIQMYGGHGYIKDNKAEQDNSSPLHLPLSTFPSLPSHCSLPPLHFLTAQ